MHIYRNPASTLISRQFQEVASGNDGFRSFVQAPQGSQREVDALAIIALSS